MITLRTFCLSFLLVASFSSRKNVKYGHGSIAIDSQTGIDIRLSSNYDLLDDDEENRI